MTCSGTSPLVSATSYQTFCMQSPWRGAANIVDMGIDSGVPMHRAHRTERLQIGSRELCQGYETLALPIRALGSHERKRLTARIPPLHQTRNRGSGYLSRQDGEHHHIEK